MAAVLPSRRLFSRSRRSLSLAGALLVLGACWLLLRRYRHTLSGGGGGGAANAVDGTCPVAYPRHTMDDIRAGAKPYLLGGIAQKPGCTACARPEFWATACQFTRNQPLCPAWAQQAMINGWLQRGFELALSLTPCDLWRYLHGRTLLLIGDSQMLDMYKALSCFLFELWPDLKNTPFSDDPELQTQLTRSGVPPMCARLQQGSRVCYIRMNKGEDVYGVMLPLVPRVARPSDLLVVNFGLHHGTRDYSQRLKAFAAYYQQHAAALPRLLWQQTSAQHFGSVAGEYSGGNPPFTCAKLQHYSVVGEGIVQLEPGQADPGHILQGGWRNALADPVMHSAGIPVLPSYNETVPLHNMHRDNGKGHECTHFCHPSAPQTWVLALYRTLKGLEERGEVAAAEQQQGAGGGR